MKKGDLLYKPSGTLFSFHSMSENLKARLIEFHIPHAMHGKLLVGGVEVMELPEQDYVRIKSYFDLIHDTVKEREQLSYSIEHLGMVVKAVSRKSFQQCINEVSLYMAEDLMKRDHLNMKEVATKTGFKNLSSFCRFFKKHTGMTPMAFRNGKNLLPDDKWHEENAGREKADCRVIFRGN